MDLTALAYLSCCFFSTFVVLECIVFELDDYDLNRVILVGESNIVMTCSASEVSHPQYEIRHEGVIINDNQQYFRVTTTRASVEVTITQVQNTHGGEYECLVTGGGMMIVSNLTLDVRDPDTEPGVYCSQSGETLTAHEGDSLSLFCYFLWAGDNGNFTSRDFVWQLINGSTLVSLDSTIVTRSPNFFKGLAEVLIGPLTSEDNLTEYQCYHRKRRISGNKPCFVGPVFVITETVDISTAPTHTSSTPVSETSTMVIPNTAYISTTTTHAPRTPTPTPSQMGSSNEVQSPPFITVNPSHSQTYGESTISSTSDLQNTHKSSTWRGTNKAKTTETLPSDDSTITIIIISCVIAAIILIAFTGILLCLIFTDGKSQKHEKKQTQENSLESTKSNPSDHQNVYLEPAVEMLTGSSNDKDTVSNLEPSSGGTENIDQTPATYDKVNHNILFTKSNGQNKSGKYDDVPVGIAEPLDPSTLHRKPNKLEKNRNQLADVSDIDERSSSKSEPSNGGRYIDHNCPAYDQVKHNPDMPKLKGHKKSGKYDETPTGIQEGQDPRTLDGRLKKSRQNSNGEDDVSDLDESSSSKSEPFSGGRYVDHNCPAYDQVAQTTAMSNLKGHKKSGKYDESPTGIQVPSKLKKSPQNSDREEDLSDLRENSLSNSKAFSGGSYVAHNGSVYDQVNQNSEEKVYDQCPTGVPESFDSTMMSPFQLSRSHQTNVSDVLSELKSKLNKSAF